MYKATIMKNLFSSNPFSKDRLRRMQGLSNFKTEETDVSIETAVMFGDPILVNIKKKVNVTQIKMIKKGAKKGAKKVKMLDVNDINNKNIFIDVLVLCLEGIDNEFVWKRKLTAQFLSHGLGEPMAYGFQTLAKGATLWCSRKHYEILLPPSGFQP